MSDILKPLCFVLMPFSHAVSARRKYDELNRDNLDTIFEMIKRIIQRLGYRVRRASNRGDILAGIVLDLDQADLVVADLTGLNPNVMYELGIRHGFTKRTILLSQDIAELPFDLKNYHCIEYKWKNRVDQKRLSDELRTTLADINSDPTVRFGPVHSHLGSKRLALKEEELRLTTKRLDGLIAELHVPWERLQDALKHTKQLNPHAFEEDSDVVKVKNTLDSAGTNPFFQTAAHTLPSTYPAIDLLLTSRYLPDELDHNSQVTTFYRYLGGLRFHHLDDRDYSNLSFLSLMARLSIVLSDTIKLRDAVRTGSLGTDLLLYCVRDMDKQGKDEPTQTH